jgi:hypothetical protein
MYFSQLSTYSGFEQFFHRRKKAPGLWDNGWQVRRGEFSIYPS